MEICLDIIIITFNSEKWIEKCFRALSRLEYDKKKISISVFDNGSNDNTVFLLKQQENFYRHLYSDFKIYLGKKNYGFGVANNKAICNCKNKYVFLLNIDTEISKDALTLIVKDINEFPDFAMWEMRQIPYEHPKYYDIKTGETSWCSCAAVIIRRDIFEEVGGFDSNIFMYAEDVDLSWRFRLKGYHLRYCPSATVTHYSNVTLQKRTEHQIINSIVGNIYLRRKYGTMIDIFGGVYFVFLNMLAFTIPLHCKIVILQQVYNVLQMHIQKMGKCTQISVPNFVGENYEIERQGKFYHQSECQYKEKIGIYIKAEIYREIIDLLQRQTYKNLEVYILNNNVQFKEKYISVILQPCHFFWDHYETLLSELELYPKIYFCNSVEILSGGLIRNCNFGGEEFCSKYLDIKYLFGSKKKIVEKETMIIGGQNDIYYKFIKDNHFE